MLNTHTFAFLGVFGRIMALLTSQVIDKSQKFLDGMYHMDSSIRKD
jgi:hypothetical protein